jgi:hypothetical protein
MRKSQIALGIASALGVAGAAQAVNVTVELTGVKTGSPNGTTAGAISGRTHGTYNTTTGIVTMAAGTTSILYDLNPLPNNNLFTHNHSNWSTGGGAYTASAYSCVEGQFGPNVGAALCGNYNYGANYIHESSTNYNSIPGTRVIGGDDVAVGPQQQGSDYGASTASYNGTTLLMTNAAWTGGSGSSSTAGVQLSFQVVPVPAAVWLFGSALGLLGWVRKRATA